MWHSVQMHEKFTTRVLPVVKAYPETSKKYGQTVCVAAVTVPEGRWIRLYPIRFTLYPPERQFKKYQLFDVVAQKADNDSRPESHKIDEASIEIIGTPLGTGNGWSERKRLLASALDSSLCELQRLQKVQGKSLGMIRVGEITGFDIVEADEEKYEKAEKKSEYAATPDLFDDKKLKIEPLPFKFRYLFRCTDPSCKGHKCSIIDWEAYELHRKMIAKWGRDVAFEKVRQKYVDDICGPSKETYFFMGNMQRHPESFLVLGAFYPPMDDSPTLFEFAELDPSTRTEVPAKHAPSQPDPALFPND